MSAPHLPAPPAEDARPRILRKAPRRPVSPFLPAFAVMGVAGTLVGLIASSFPFDPIGRQIAWIGSSFTLTATCIAYVIQSGRRTAWDEARYQAQLRRKG